MLDAETLNPGKQLAIIWVSAKFTCCKNIQTLYFSCLFAEWNITKDINNQAAVNGVLESVPDGIISAHVQVMLIAALKHLLILQVFFFMGLMVLKKDFTIFLVKAVKLINFCSTMSSGAYLNHPLCCLLKSHITARWRFNKLFKRRQNIKETCFSFLSSAQCVKAFIMTFTMRMGYNWLGGVVYCNQLMLGECRHYRCPYYCTQV